jgi:hypothetical protein
MITYGVMLHNDGDSREAIGDARKALESEPSNSHIEYCPPRLTRRSATEPRLPLPGSDPGGSQPDSRLRRR